MHFFRQLRELKAALNFLGVTRSDALIAASLSVLLAAIDSVGMGLIFPVLVYLERGAAGFAPAAGGLPAQIGSVLAMLHVPITLFTLLALALGPNLLRQWIAYLGLSHGGRVTDRVNGQLQAQLVDAVVRADHEFHLKRNSGELNSLLAHSCGSAAQLARSAVLISSYALIVLAYFVVLMWLAPQLALAAAAVMLPVV